MQDLDLHELYFHSTSFYFIAFNLFCFLNAGILALDQLYPKNAREACYFAHKKHPEKEPYPTYFNFYNSGLSAYFPLKFAHIISDICLQCFQKYCWVSCINIIGVEFLLFSLTSVNPSLGKGHELFFSVFRNDPTYTHESLIY